MSSHSGGGGGDLHSLICPELGVAPLVDPGTDLEDELPSPAASPVAFGNGVAPLPAQAEEDIELASGSVGCSSVPPTIPAMSTSEESLLQPWVGPLSGGESAGSHLPAASLTPRPATTSPHDGESDAVWGRLDVPDVSREGPFDIHQGHPNSDASPRLLQGTQGCPFRMTSYDGENGGPDFTPAYGVQLHDPRLLEYVGAPESARLLSRSPEYWVNHMGREKTLSAALQLQHDAGLILSNVQVLQQLVTALNRASSDVMWAVHGRRPFPTNAMQQVMPSYRVRRAAHYMTAMGLWRPPVAPEIRGPLPFAKSNACMSCSDCFPDVPL